MTPSVPGAALVSGLVMLTVAHLAHAPHVRATAGDDELIHEGVQLRRQGRNAEALEAFQRAYGIRPTLRAQAQIALAQQALGQWVAAEKGLEAVLVSQQDPWIQRHRVALEMALDTVRRHLGTLEVDTNLGGAEIFVDGRLVGRAPLPEQGVRVAAGSVRIEVRTAAGASMVRDTMVPAEGVARASIVALQVSDAETGFQGGQSSAAVADKEEGPVAQAAMVRQSARGSWGLRGPAWVALGASVPLLGTAVTAHVVRQNNAVIYNDDGRCFRDGLTRDQRCGHVRDRVQLAEVIAIIAYALTGASAIAGLVMLNVGEDERVGGPVMAPVSVTGDPTGVRVEWSGLF